MIIRNKRQLSRTLSSIARIKIRQTALSLRLEAMNNAVLRYFKRKHRTKFIDEDGTTWQQMQGSTAVYDDKAFKTLLESKGINPETVYKSRIIIERDDSVITKLLKEKRISIEEWKTVARIKYYSPYLRRFEPRQNKSRGNGTNSDSGISASETLNRVRDRSKT